MADIEDLAKLAAQRGIPLKRGSKPVVQSATENVSAREELLESNWEKLQNRLSAPDSELAKRGRLMQFRTELGTGNNVDTIARRLLDY